MKHKQPSTEGQNPNEIFKCVCGFRTEEKSLIGSHVRIMDGVYGKAHYEVK